MATGRAWIVCGLGFGDEGKGALTDFLARERGVRAVVRFNGGPQAGHNVVDPEGRWHCFAQFGAGTFVPGCRTLLAPGMLVELENLAAEAAVLRAKGVADAAERLQIDPHCALITPMHKMIGQMREVARGRGAVGTCGLGVGQAVRDRARGSGVSLGDLLTARGGDLLERIAAEREAEAAEIARLHPSLELEAIRAHFRRRCRPALLLRRYREVCERLGLRIAPVAPALRATLESGNVVFEGAQGALLDPESGLAPFVTRTPTTCAPALTLLADATRGRRDGPTPVATRLGLLRAYGHRHGPGPFPTEDARFRGRFADPYNPANRWQGLFRVGRLDRVTLRYGITLNGGVDRLAVSGLDRLSGLREIRVCASYEYRGDFAGLDEIFDWDRLEPGRARVTGLRRPGNSGDAEGGALARALRRCRPLEWIRLPGWRGDLRGARTPGDLPRPVREFIDFLEGTNGLGTPVALVAVGPDATGRIECGTLR